MGVKGLNRFLDSNSDYFETFDIRGKKIIIDGCGLIYQLYYTREIAYEFGGDYNKYAGSVRNYFKTLKNYNIIPVVIFNGVPKINRQVKSFLKTGVLKKQESVNDFLNIEFRKHKFRQEKRLKSIDYYLNGGPRFSFTPINHYEVFKNTLSEMGITHAQCDYGGDEDIAALATHHGCPVVGEDSDFYIYDLPYGFIRFSHLDTVLSEAEKTGTTTVKIYYIETFISKHSIQEGRLLFLFAALLGNDYTTFKFFERFHSSRGFIFKRRFTQVLTWLSAYKTLSEAIQDVLKCYHGNFKIRISNKINYIIMNYELEVDDGERMSNILQRISVNCVEDINKNTDICYICGKSLPEQFIVDFYKGCVSSTMLNIIQDRPSFLHSQIELFTYSSSYSCSRYIRQITYSILLKHDPRNSDLHEKHCTYDIVEYDRLAVTDLENVLDKSAVPITVKICSELKNGVEIPGLSEIYVKPKNYLRSFVAAVLGVDENFFEDIPVQLQLLFGCIIYWLWNAEPKPTKEFLSALLICIIYNQWNNLQDNASKIEQMGSITTVVENSEKYFNKPLPTQPFDVNVIHYYSQLQTCIMSTVSLNSLLNRPFDATKLCEFLNGTMLYNLTKELELTSNSDLFIETSLGGEDSDTFKLFTKYITKIYNIIHLDYFERH